MKRLITIFAILTGLTGNAQLIGAISSTRPSPPVSSLLTNLVSYWKFDEASGTAADQTGGNTGTVTSVLYSAAGKVGTAFSFDGTASGVDMGNPASLQLTSTGSISVWVFPTNIAAANDQSIVCKADPTTNRNGYNLMIPSSFSSTFYFEYNSASASQLIQIWGTTLTNSTWYHVVVTWNGTNIIAYVNGTQVSSNAQTLTAVSNVKNFTVGQSTVGDNAHFNGRIDEVGIWNRAITSTEVTTLYNAGSGKTHPFN